MSDKAKAVSAPSAAETLGAMSLRSDWYRDQYRKAWTLIYGLVGICLVLGLATTVLVMRWPTPIAYGLTPDLRAIRLEPLSSELPPEDVRQWAQKATVAAYTLDYAHFRDQLNSLEGLFTPEGYEGFLDGLKRGGLQDQITQQSYVVSAVVTAVPSIIRKGLQNGAFTWVLKVPVTVSYQNGPSTTSQTLLVTLIANRVSLAQNPSGIAIKNLIARRQ